MKNIDRDALRGIVRGNADIDVMIVRLTDGSNEFFSAQPEVERCQRMRVVRICREIADTLEAMRPGAALLRKAQRGRHRARAGDDESRSACPR